MDEKVTEHVTEHSTKQVLSIEEMPQWLVDKVINGKMDLKHDHLDNVVSKPTDDV